MGAHRWGCVLLDPRCAAAGPDWVALRRFNRKTQIEGKKTRQVKTCESAGTCGSLPRSYTCVDTIMNMNEQKRTLAQPRVATHTSGYHLCLHTHVGPHSPRRDECDSSLHSAPRVHLPAFSLAPLCIKTHTHTFSL